MSWKLPSLSVLSFVFFSFQGESVREVPKPGKLAPLDSPVRSVGNRPSSLGGGGQERRSREPHPG